MHEAGFWVFGYGSLLWNPGFEYAERRLARLDGFRRSFCMAPIEYRGTPEAPGLVLALDTAPGQACEGLAFRVAPGEAERAYAYLTARELVTAAYREHREVIALDDGRRAEALCYVVDPAHGQYAGGLALEEQARIIASAVGPNGPNRDYLFNTVASLQSLGLHDPELEALSALVRRSTAGEVG